MEVKRFRFDIFLVILFCVIAVSLLYHSEIFLYAQNIIRYLPRNEDMTTSWKDYSGGLGLGQIVCPAITDALNNATKCNYCFDDLKAYCPDCCLGTNQTSGLPAVQCTAGQASAYACKNAAFGVDTCPGDVDGVECADYTAPNGVMQNCANMNAIPGCQTRGCPTGEPRHAANVHCTNTTGTWICDSNTLTEHDGCPAQPQSLTPLPVKPYYTVSAPVACPAAISSANCYEYTYRPGFASYMSNCPAYTRDMERCMKRVNCCQNNVCDPSPRGGSPGFAYNCDTARCQELIGMKSECDRWQTSQDCAAENLKVQQCLTGSTLCSLCYKEIDSSFTYRFVAKSRDAVVLLWQLGLQSKGSAHPGSPSLFTKVRIYEVEGNQEKLVHESMPHQKMLKSAFSIFCATHVGKNVLKQGRAYVARAYYFLPEGVIPAPTGNPQKNEVVVRNIRFILVRVRE